jgi:hypothetical protein
MPQPIPTLESSLRWLRIVYAVIFFTMIQEVLVAEKLSHHQLRDVHTFWVGLMVICLPEIAIALFFRFRMLRPAEDTLQSMPDDQFALGRWRAANILSFVISNAVVLFGFAVRFVGGTSMQAMPFYIVGFSMMLLWWPQRP